MLTFVLPFDRTVSEKVHLLADLEAWAFASVKYLLNSVCINGIEDYIQQRLKKYKTLLMICRRTTLKTVLLQHFTVHQEINTVLSWRATEHCSHPRLWLSQSRDGARTPLGHRSHTPAEPGLAGPGRGAGRGPRGRGCAEERGGRTRWVVRWWWPQALGASRAVSERDWECEERSGAGPCRAPPPQPRASGSARPCWAGWRRPGPAGEVREPGRREWAGHRRPQVNEPQGRGRAAAAGQRQGRGLRRAPLRPPAGQRLRAAGFTGTG